MDLNELTSLVEQGNDLSQEQAELAADRLASAEIEGGAKAKFLLALSEKGEVAAEVAGFAQRFRELARDPGLGEWQSDAIDVCGTGGDKMGSFNISTTVAFALAAAGVPVFKHGNRSITSKCGSANLLEALGVDLMADDATLKESMRELGFCFMFAPAFHPAFKEIMPVRQSLAAEGKRTVFNILGPLINPARPAYQLLGVYSASVVEMLAGALESLGLQAGLVAHCSISEGKGMDELSVAGVNLVAGLGDIKNEKGEWLPEAFGLPRAPVSDLLGGDLEDNLRILQDLVQGKAPQGLEDSICLNVAAALMVAGKADSVKSGIAAARDIVVGGALQQKLTDTKEFYRSR